MVGTRVVAVGWDEASKYVNIFEGKIEFAN